MARFYPRIKKTSKRARLISLTAYVLKRLGCWSL